MPVTSNIIQRTFHLKYGSNVGSCFIFPRGDLVYLVTAKHLVFPIRSIDSLEIEHDSGWIEIETNLIGHGKGEEDVSVFSLKEDLRSDLPLEISMAGMTLSGDVHFLGFPFDMKTTHALNYGYPFPFVNKASVSAISETRDILFLDGQNNPGFSGGPIVLADKPNQVVGIICSYQLSHENVNSGIIRACSANVINRILGT